jgi:hydroxymethylbilane synthase
MAGLNRLAMDEVPRTAIEAEEMLPAVAQGCIGIEQRLGDVRVSEMLNAINDTLSTQRLAAERAFLGALDGSCETPIGGLATIEGDVLTLRGEILRVDGSEVLSDEQSCSVADGAKLGVEMARKLRSKADDDFFSWLN